MPWEDTDAKREGHMKTEARDWSDAFTSQRMPRIASNHQKLEEARKNSFSKAYKNSIIFGFGLLVSVTERINFFLF